MLFRSGEQGLQGETGPTGPTGPTGEQGPAGLLPDGTAAGNTPYWDGSAWVTGSGNLHNAGGSVGVGTATPAASAKLEISSTSQGFLPPRLTTAQILAIASPAEGLLVYNTDLKRFYGYSEMAWRALGWSGVLIQSQVYAEDSIVGILRFVPNGFFTQGSPADEPCRNGDETQFTHTLTRHLAVMETEVTRQMWADLRAEQPSLPADPTITTYGAGLSNPVQNNTWYEAVLFANLLSLQQGLTRCYYADAGFTTPIDATNYTAGNYHCDFAATGYRLLTEGEWEYCCRAGTTTTFWIAEPNFTSGTCGTSSPGLFAALETAAWFVDNSSSLNASSPAGTKAANPWGLYDIHGNVWEWCWDRYGTYPAGSTTDHAGATSGSDRVYRGGGWGNIALYCRSADRLSSSPNNRSHNIGFRLARSLP